MVLNNRDVVLNVLFTNPSNDFHIRSLARITNLNPNTVITITDELEKEGLIKKVRDKDTNRVIIKSTNSDLFTLKKIFYNIESIFSSGLIDFLNDALAYPTIFLFGSYAKGENHEKSDIDLFILSSEKKDLDLSSFEKKLSSEIQLFIQSSTEFSTFRKNNVELLNNIINGIKLTGFLEVY